MTRSGKHVCIVTSAHPRDDVRVGSRMASAFLEGGYQVTWVGPDFSHFQATASRNEEIDYRLFPSSRGRLDRVRASRRAFAIADRVPDVDWWYSPDPDAATRLPRLARRRGGLTMFDVHESYHGGLLDRWFPGRPPRVVRELVRRRIARTCARTDLVVGVSDAVLTPYTRSTEQTLVVRNCAPSWFGTADTGDGPDSDRMLVMHGKLATGNGTAQVVEAASRLPQRIAAAIAIQVLEPVGSAETPFGRQVRDRATSLAGHPIELRPGVSHEEMSSLMQQCSVGLISYQRDLGLVSLPNRLFEYMAAGTAVFAPSYSPDIVAILESEQIGRHADFEDPAAIRDGLAWFVDHPEETAEMGRRARRAFESSYNWDAESARLIALMRSLES